MTHREKACTKCNRMLPFECFRSHPLGKFGLHSQCKDCQREYARTRMARLRVEQPEKVAETKRQYQQRAKIKIKADNHRRYVENREQRLIDATEYRERNRDKINAYLRDYFRRNRDLRAEKDRQYYALNRERIAIRSRHYRQCNRVRIRLLNRARKIRIRISTKDFTERDWRVALEFFCHTCAICGRAQNKERIIAADHWIPLSKGGATDKFNIIPLCHGVDGCNNKKKDKHPDLWLLNQFGEHEANEIISLIEDYFNSLK